MKCQASMDYVCQPMESGQVGSLLSDTPADQLAVVIHRVMAGERVVDPEFALSTLSDVDNRLTPRERDVLRASLEDTSIADIAAQLFLPEGTVRNHVSAAIQKLSVRSRKDAAHLV